MPSKSITLTIDSDLAQVSLIGQSVNNFYQEVMPSIDAHQLEICVVEAVNNVIIHAYGRQPGNTVRVCALIHPDCVEIHISDWGTKMPEQSTPTLEFDPTDDTSLPEGGMGLFLIYTTMDRMEYLSEQGINTLILAKNLARSP